MQTREQRKKKKRKREEKQKTKTKTGSVVIKSTKKTSLNHYRNPAMTEEKAIFR